MDTDMPRVVIIGHVCIDRNTTEHNSYTSWGSSALYIAQYIQQQYHARPLVVTEYGADLLPYVPDGIRLLPVKPTQSASLRYENDTSIVPRIWRCFNTEFSPEPALTTAVIEALRAADIVFVATLLPNYSSAFLERALSYTKPTALRVLCPQGNLRQVDTEGLVQPRDFTEAPELVPKFTLTIYSEEDTPSALRDAAIWAKQCETRIIVTQGENGASIFEHGDCLRIPTTPLSPDQIVDSVGCGDVFQAAVAYEYYATQDLPSAVRAAHIAAANKLTASIGEPSKCNLAAACSPNRKYSH